MTGLHALDGARYLRDAHQADALLCRLVAHHSYAIVEAEERGIADILGLEFEPAPYELSSVLTCCDMTTSPDGELVTVERRLAEIHRRYGPEHLVGRSIQRATPMILCGIWLGAPGGGNLAPGMAPMELWNVRINSLSWRGLHV